MPDSRNKVYFGDCLASLRQMAADSIDSLVTDPPAGISFMGKHWDGDLGGRDSWINWMTNVMHECLRVLKPGAQGLVWALPRTSHWTATALEDAGFEIRDVVTHLFGTGFPKSLDISKAIDKAAGEEREITGPKSTYRKPQEPNGWDCTKRAEFETAPATATATAKQWQGWGTALKPASEHWILIRKPLSEKTVAANVLKWGVGGINVDGCRVAAADQDKLAKNWDRSAPAGFGNGLLEGGLQTGGFQQNKKIGRFPANLVLDEDAAAMLDEQSGVGVSPTGKSKRKGGQPIAMSGAHASRIESNGFGDKGGASRFFYVAKASKSERGADNNHPTVKSLALMSYLIRLVTPPGGIVLDPFMGSGSTGVAAKAERMRFVGIEQEHEYFKIAQKRLENG